MTNADTQVEPVRQGNGLAIAGMILGILSLVSFWIVFVSVPLGLVGFILSILGMGQAKTTGTGKGMAVTGLVLSILGIVASVGLLVLIWFWKDMITSVADSWNTIRDGGDANR